MSSTIKRVRDAATSLRHRGGLKYLSTGLAAIQLPKLASRWDLPFADKIVAWERAASHRPWYSRGPVSALPPARRLSCPGLEGDPTDPRLLAVEAAINFEHSRGRVGLTADELTITDEGATFASPPFSPRELATAAFERARDDDRKRLATQFGLDILHRARILELIEAARAQENYWYSPIDFGRGITTGGTWGTAAGSGRWDFLNGPIVGPLVREKRVLNLGTNNGVGGLSMLRAGAAHVTAIEYEPGYASVARLAQRIASWADICNYQLDVKRGDMRSILHADLPPFDVVTAFCSLYYLEEADIFAMAKKVGTVADTFILQSNDAKHNTKADSPRRRLASLEFTREIARVAGYPSITVHRPDNYPRALVVASR